MKIRIATRASQLALTQTRSVAAMIRQAKPEIAIEEIHVQTKGDRVQDRPLAEVGGKGLFVSEVEAAVVRGDADIAVHSLKDVPGDVPLADGMELLAFPIREDARDVLLTPDGRDLHSLGRGAKIGTTSLRRTVQLKQQRPDLQFATLRGNIDTRLKRLRNGDFDAIVLAAAGLRRLGVLDGLPHQRLSPDLCLPAVGQGVVAVEGAADNDWLRECVGAIDHARTRTVVFAERNMLQILRGNCHSPIAGHATLETEPARLHLEGMVASHDGDRVLTASSDRYLNNDEASWLDAAVELGREVAECLLERGARKLIDQAAVSAEQRRLTSN